LTGKPHEVKDALTGKVYTAKVKIHCILKVSLSLCILLYAHNLLSSYPVGHYLGTGLHSHGSSGHYGRRVDCLHQ
jgi:hypothetical protein